MPQGPLQDGDELIVWTTTPWTLVSNAAVAVDAGLTYVRARVPGEDHALIVAEALVARVLGEDAEILDRFPGAALDGVRYEAPFSFLPAETYGPRGHTVLLADFVTADGGSGLVHTAVAFGEDDFRLGQEAGLTVVNPVKLDGTYDERIGPYAGRFVKDADADLVEDLRARGKLLRAEDYEHAYPHCWRCGTPLLYYAKPSWYIATSKIRDTLLASNEQIDWHPPHIKEGRFGDWLRGNVDWALSRERYWGTPLPVWRCDNAHIHCIGSFDELEELSGVRLEDPHRPVRGRRRLPVPALRRAHDARARGHRRLVRLGLHAVRAVARADREPGALRGALPRRLHLRGDRPDARLVLLAARGLGAAVRAARLQVGGVPRAHPRRAGPQDEQVARQHRGAVGRARRLRGRRVPLVLLHEQAAVGRLPLQRRGGRRGRAPLPQAALEHVRVPGALRERGR